MSKEECGLDATAKEALRDLSHLENYLEESDAPANMKNRAVDVRLCIKELREGVKPIGTQAAANKAEEEGGLSDEQIKTIATQIGMGTYSYELDPRAYDLRFARSIIEADRASRQVANKAEVEPAKFKRLSEDQVREIAMDHLHDDTESAARNGFFTFSAEGLDGFAIELMDALATPPSTTGASTAPVETFIELRNRVADLESQLAECMRQTAKWAAAAGEADGRNYKAREVALEEAARHFEQAPFDQAKVAMVCSEIRALKGSVGASTVLTDERIKELCDEYFQNQERGMVFARAIEREVAAQAGQVAVPEADVRNAALEEAAAVCDELHYNWKFDDEPDSDSGPRSCAKGIRALAAPSPAKESK